MLPYWNSKKLLPSTPKSRKILTLILRPFKSPKNLWSKTNLRIPNLVAQTPPWENLDLRWWPVSSRPNSKGWKWTPLCKIATAWRNSNKTNSFSRSRKTTATQTNAPCHRKLRPSSSQWSRQPKCSKTKRTCAQFSRQPLKSVPSHQVPQRECSPGRTRRSKLWSSSRPVGVQASASHCDRKPVPIMGSRRGRIQNEQNLYRFSDIKQNRLFVQGLVCVVSPVKYIYINI